MFMGVGMGLSAGVKKQGGSPPLSPAGNVCTDVAADHLLVTVFHPFYPSSSFATKSTNNDSVFTTTCWILYGAVTHIPEGWKVRSLIWITRVSAVKQTVTACFVPSCASQHNPSISVKALWSASYDSNFCPDACEGNSRTAEKKQKQKQMSPVQLFQRVDHASYVPIVRKLPTEKCKYAVMYMWTGSLCSFNGVPVFVSCVFLYISPMYFWLHEYRIIYITFSVLQVMKPLM